MYLNVEQGTAAWFQNRIGKLTASKMNDALDVKKDGSDGAKRKALKMEIVAERLTDIPVPHFVSEPMRWGKQYEPMAKERFAEKTGLTVIECGTFDHPTIEYLAASPDGLIQHDGLLETKCPTSQTHLIWMLQKTCPGDYKPQMLIQLSCSRRKWCKFASFDPRMPDPQKLRIWDFEPTMEQIQEMEAKAIQFLLEVEELFELVKVSA
jgi:putative phage-type endonuclease